MEKAEVCLNLIIGYTLRLATWKLIKDRERVPSAFSHGFGSISGKRNIGTS